MDVGAMSSWGSVRELPYMAKPTAIDAKLVKRTCGRADTRRSTSGALRRSSHHPHTRKLSAETARSPRVFASPHPQVPPLVMGSNRVIRPTVRPSAPTKSKRPGRRTVDSGMTNATSAMQISPNAADVTKRKCQLAFWAITAAIGSPIAPPTPRVALMTAIAPATFFGGRTSRMMAMPNGIAPTDAP